MATKWHADLLRLGRAAAVEGKAASDNPYPKGSDDHIHWHFGFLIQPDANLLNRRKSNPEGT